MIINVLIGLIVLTAVALIITILMQSGQGGGLSSSFGGSFMSGAIFGGKGAEAFLAKMTVILGITFVILIISVNFMLRPGGTTSTSSDVFQDAEAQPTSQPAIPSTTPGTPSNNASAKPITTPVSSTPKTAPAKTPASETPAQTEAPKTEQTQ